MKAERWGKTYRAGARLARLAAASLTRAAEQARRAEDHAAEATAKMSPLLHGEDVWMPRSFFLLGRLAQLIERAENEISAAVGADPRLREARRGETWLVRAAARSGIRATANTWCLAFIALRMDEPVVKRLFFSKRIKLPFLEE
jgi:hypothetical protein